MAGNVHAIVLIALPLLTVAGCVAYRKAPRSVLHVLGALGAGVGSGVAVASFSVHACAAGQPLAQWAIPAGCVTLALLFVGHTFARRAWVALTLVVMVAASFDFSARVHGPHSTGNPDVGRYEAAQAEESRRAVEAKLRTALFEDPIHREAGWLRDAPFFAAVTPRLDGTEFDPGQRTEVQALWHSGLTGLYEKRTFPTDLWFTGGRGADVGLEIRERPRADARHP